MNTTLNGKESNYCLHFCYVATKRVVWENHFSGMRMMDTLTSIKSQKIIKRMKNDLEARNLIFLETTNQK